jgi:predicted ATPase
MTKIERGNHVIISGCSGGGKSTLLEELRQRGEAVVEEPGRRIVAEQLKGDGKLLPWVDPEAFARRAIELSLQDRGQADSHAAWVFFDRGLIDAAVALEHMTGEPAEHLLSSQPRFYPRVFLAPPWPEIYQTDAQRQHAFDEAVAEYLRLEAAYPRLGYTVERLPKASVHDRVDFVLSRTRQTCS